MNTDFLQELRDRSIKIKLKSDLKFGGAVDFKTLIDSLKAISKSYDAYVKATFLNDLNQEFTDKNIKETRQLQVDNQLLIVDLSFNSFEASITPDTKSYNSEIPYKSSGNKWKKDTFNLYQKEVIFGDYNDASFRKSLKSKYNDEARRKIFKPLLEVESTADLQFQNEFSGTLTSPTIVANQLIYEDLVPPKIYVDPPPTEEKTYKVYLKSTQDPDLFGNRLIVDELLGVEQLEKDIYPYRPLKIDDEFDSIEFNSPQNFEVKFDDESNIYIIESEELDISAWGQDRASAEDSFDFLFIETFKAIAIEEDVNLTPKAIELKKRLKSVVKEYKHIQ